mmetsp:Transcript_26409/g.57914  ORF Transcript_26409/g.57914 Transcript_26409/m.57914 type:complete len:391 (+) Transcript_26409:63-1235(+)
MSSPTDDDGTMLAFMIPSPGDKHGEVRRIPIPSPSPGFCLVKVLRAGVCNTDLEILQGYMGFHGVLGHEFVGRVVEVNTDNDAIKTKWLDRRVCGDINVGCASCGVCDNAFGLDGRCSKMSRNHCPNRTVLGILNKDGTFAEYLTLPISNLHLVPDDMSDEIAVFSEPLAAACRIVEQGLVRYQGTHPDKVAILGDGKLGLMIAEVLGREHSSRLGPNADAPYPVLFGKHQHKLDFVRDSAGVDCRNVSEAKDEKAFNGVASEHAGKYDVVVDATGSPAGLSLAAGLCRPMGTLVLKSTCAAGEQFNAAPFVIDELKVVGSRCGPIDKALELLALDMEVEEGAGDINKSIQPLRVSKYLTKTFPLSEATEAIKCAAERTTMKVQIICSEE